MKTRDAMADARRRLEIAGVSDPARDVSALLDAAGAGIEDELAPDVADRFRQMVDRRVRRQPVSQITGRRAFWMHDFEVTPDVLDPRPETETLVQAALSARAEALHDPKNWPADGKLDWPPIPFRRVLDLGTGSGCILTSLLHEVPEATGVGTDISAAALAVAARNAQRTGTADRAQFLQSDWFASVEGVFDLIVSNPPYISAAEMPDLSPEVRDWEPHLALTPGGDGLTAYRQIAAGAADHLVPGGALMVEIGATQGPDVRQIFEDAGLHDIRILPDLDGRDRVVSARMACQTP